MDDKLALNAPGMLELVVARAVTDGERTEVELFGEKISSLSAGSEASSWFSQYLGGDYRVVACDPEFLRNDFSAERRDQCRQPREQGGSLQAPHHGVFQ